MIKENGFTDEQIHALMNSDLSQDEIEQLLQSGQAGKTNSQLEAQERRRLEIQRREKESFDRLLKDDNPKFNEVAFLESDLDFDEIYNTKPAVSTGPAEKELSVMLLPFFDLNSWDGIPVKLRESGIVLTTIEQIEEYKNKAAELARKEKELRQSVKQSEKESLLSSINDNAFTHNIAREEKPILPETIDRPVKRVEPIQEPIIKQLETVQESDYTAHSVQRDPAGKFDSNNSQPKPADTIRPKPVQSANGQFSGNKNKTDRVKDNYKVFIPDELLLLDLSDAAKLVLSEIMFLSKNNQKEYIDHPRRFFQDVLCMSKGNVIKAFKELAERNYIMETPLLGSNKSRIYNNYEVENKDNGTILDADLLRLNTNIKNKILLGKIKAIGKSEKRFVKCEIPFLCTLTGDSYHNVYRRINTLKDAGFILYDEVQGWISTI